MASLLLYSVLLRYAIARPTSPTSVTSLSADSTTNDYATTSDCPSSDSNYRSTLQIVWSCLTVVIASSWLCVHPNVAGHSTTMWKRLHERLLLFVVAIFAPEAMATFAFYQWRGSRRLYEDFERRAKKLNISLLDSEHPSDPVDDSDTASTTRPPISEETRDLLVLSARDSANSGSTIERLRSLIKTLARAISSFGMDPKNAKWSYTHAHFIQMGGIAFRDTNGEVGFNKPEAWTDEDIKAFFAMNLREGAISDRSKAGTLAKTLVVARVLWFLIQAIARNVQGLPISLLEVSSLAFISFNFAMYVFWWNKPLDVEYPLEISGRPDGRYAQFYRPGIWPIFAPPMGMLDNIPIGEWINCTNPQSYPRLYAFGERRVFDGRDNKLIFRLTIAVTSSFFGAFHTIGWYLPAPSQAERALWRVSCLVLTFYPLALLVIITCISTNFATRRINAGSFFDSSFCCGLVVLGCLGFLCGIAHVGTRLTLILLSFLELRDLPPLSHCTVSWSKFLSPI